MTTRTAFLLLLCDVVALTSCGPKQPDYSGTYARLADDEVYRLTDTIWLKKLDVDARRSYVFERKVYAQYKDNETPRDTTIKSGFAQYDPSRDVLAVERSEQEWIIDNKRGILQSGKNQYRRLR